MKLRDLILNNLDVSVSQFCKDAGVSRPTIDDIIHRRKRHTLSLLTIKKICKYFGVDPKNYIE